MKEKYNLFIIKDIEDDKTILGCIISSVLKFEDISDIVKKLKKESDINECSDFYNFEEVVSLLQEKDPDLLSCDEYNIKKRIIEM